MNKLKSMLLATASAIAVTHAASAADFVKAPKAAPPFSWTGFYVGGNLGAARHDWTFADMGVNGGPPAFAFPPGTTFWDSSSWGVIAGGQVGYNLQYDRYIFGIEGDFNYLSNSASATFNPARFPPINAEAKAQWLATARGRLGMMLSPTFVYVTGGVAFLKVHEAWGNPSVLPANAQFSIDKVKTGPIVGIGFEHALSNQWSVKAELLKAWFSNDSTNFTGFGSTYRSDFHNGLVVGRVGLNFRY